MDSIFAVMWIQIRTDLGRLNQDPDPDGQKCRRNKEEENMTKSKSSEVLYIPF
jgi:hypothetical protein